MNKLIVYSLAGILTIGIMASCGDKSGTNAASPAVSAETEISAALRQRLNQPHMRLISP